MVITLKTLVESFDPLKNLATNKFKASIAFELASLIKKFHENMEIYEEARTSAVKKHSKNGQSVDPDCISEFIDEMNELLKKEIEIPDFQLEKSEIENLELVPLHLAVLGEWFFK